MHLYVDLATMAVMHSSGVPLTDLALVLGDRHPLRVTLLDQGTPVTPSGVRPALAVKTALTNDALVLAATNLEPVDDALGLAYVGSLSVNTTQLIAAMDSAESIDLVGEVVLVAGDGSQRTSSLIRVTVRRDIMPADAVPPDDVLVNWDEMVASSLANQLPAALHDAGMYVTSAIGTAYMSPPGYDYDVVVAWSWARFRFGDDLLSGYVGNVCKVRDVYMWGLPGVTDTTPRWLDVWRRAPGGDWVLASRSAKAAAAGTETDLFCWELDAQAEIVIGDEVALHVYEGTPEAPVELPMEVARQMVTAADGRGLAAALDGPITDASVMPAMGLSCTYSDGVCVGGVPLATRTEIDRAKSYVTQANEDVYASARQVRQDAQDAQTAATSAITSATNASSSANAAQQALAAMPQVDSAGNMTLAGGLAVAGTVTANGGVRVPLPATAQEAISYEALITQQAATDWGKMTGFLEDMASSWVTYLIREMQLRRVAVQTANSSMQEGIYGNIMCDLVITMTKAAGISLIGRATDAWRFSNYMGGSRNLGYSAAATWSIRGSDKVSILLGSTGQGYGSTNNPAAACYTHPIHWSDYQLAGADYRYPLLNTVNGATYRDMTPAWQVTIYPKGYLGSSTSCLLRGTDYGRDVGDQQYIWALVPSITYLSVAFTPRRAADHKNVINRWELFVDAHYVMPMTSLFCGSGHTAGLTTKAKAHEVSSTYQVGMRMGGMRIDANPALGGANAWTIMERVVMQGAVINPVPEVTASALEVPAAGGEVTLTVSSTLAEAMYVVNDTMCGHDPAAVWCSQSAEQIPAGGGEVTLTLAANTTGQPRQVWAFIGHHYAQSAVIKINQLA